MFVGKFKDTIHYVVTRSVVSNVFQAVESFNMKSHMVGSLNNDKCIRYKVNILNLSNDEAITSARKRSRLERAPTKMKLQSNAENSWIASIRNMPSQCG